MFFFFNVVFTPSLIINCVFFFSSWFSGFEILSGLLQNENFFFFTSAHFFFTLASLIFLVGFLGLLVQHQGFLSILIKIELMYLGVNLFLIAYSFFSFNPFGFVYSFLLLAYVAAESALGLSLFFHQYLTDKQLTKLQVWY